MGNDRLRAIAHKARTDYYFFSKEILGFSEMVRTPHEEVCRHILSKKKKKKLTLMPRGTFKSSVITVAGALFKLQQNPNLRILIASETQKNAVKYVKQIKTIIEEGERFRAIFGDWVNHKNTWRDNEFVISKRTKTTIKEPSVQAGSLEKGMLTGMHYDLIILDDVVSLNNINTADQLEKTLNYYRMLNSILDPNGELWVNGTRYLLTDLYGMILDPKEGEYGQYEIMVKKAIQDDGSLLCPTILSREKLDELRGTQGSYIFSCQYQNDPIEEEKRVFNPEDIMYFEEAPDNLVYFMTLDLAIANNKKSDYIGLIVNGVDFEGDWWIEEARKIKCKPSVLIATVFELVKKYQPFMCLGMEKFALEKVLKFSLDEKMVEEDFFFPVKDVATNNRISKEARIKSLQPKFQKHQIHIKREHQDLVDEITFYPQVAHDDLLDALKTQIAISFPSDTPSTTKQKELLEIDPQSKMEHKDRLVLTAIDKIIKRRVRERKWKAL